jgi:AraC-like DNA-binding protein
MKAIVPIIECPHSSTQDAGLRGRIEYLLTERGFESEWIGEGNITALLKTDRSKIFVPIIIDLRTVFEERNRQVDLILPLRRTFPSALVMFDNLSSLPDRIFALPQEISLWEKLYPFPNFVCDAIKYIYAHLSNANLSITEIAHEVYTSKNTLERKFKDWNGSGVWHFVRHVRLIQAKRILLESGEQVNGVASSVGYEDYRTFSSPHAQYLRWEEKPNIYFV